MNGETYRKQIHTDLHIYNRGSMFDEYEYDLNHLAFNPTEYLCYLKFLS